MNKKTYIRLFLVLLTASVSLMLISYAHKDASGSNENADCNDSKCEPKKAQTEFIIWESISRNLLSAGR